MGGADESSLEGVAGPSEEEDEVLDSTSPENRGRCRGDSRRRSDCGEGDRLGERVTGGTEVVVVAAVEMEEFREAEEEAAGEVSRAMRCSKTSSQAPLNWVRSRRISSSE